MTNKDTMQRDLLIKRPFGFREYLKYARFFLKEKRNPLMYCAVLYILANSLVLTMFEKGSLFNGILEYIVMFVMSIILAGFCYVQLRAYIQNQQVPFVKNYTYIDRHFTSAVSGALCIALFSVGIVVILCFLFLLVFGLFILRNSFLSRIFALFHYIEYIRVVIAVVVKIIITVFWGFTFYVSMHTHLGDFHLLNYSRLIGKTHRFQIVMYALVFTLAEFGVYIGCMLLLKAGLFQMVEFFILRKAVAFFGYTVLFSIAFFEQVLFCLMFLNMNAHAIARAAGASCDMYPKDAGKILNTVDEYAVFMTTEALCMQANANASNSSIPPQDTAYRQ